MIIIIIIILGKLLVTTVTQFMGVNYSYNLIYARPALGPTQPPVQ
jgi:hypothetical protein